MKLIALLFGLTMASPVFAQSDEAKEKILRKLDHQRVSLHFDQVPLEDALDYVRDVTGMNFVLHLDGKRSPVISLRLTQVRLKSALRLLLGSHGLTAIYREGALVIVPREKVSARVVTRVYNVQDLLLKIRDFPGPDIKLSEQDCGLERVVLPEPPQERVDRDLLVDLIMANSGGGSWEEDQRTSMGLVNGLLVVTQTGPAHREIEGLLNKLRLAR